MPKQIESITLSYGGETITVTPEQMDRALLMVSGDAECSLDNADLMRLIVRLEDEKKAATERHRKALAILNNRFLKLERNIIEADGLMATRYYPEKDDYSQLRFECIENYIDPYKVLDLLLPELNAKQMKALVKYGGSNIADTIARIRESIEADKPKIEILSKPEDAEQEEGAA